MDSLLATASVAFYVVFGAATIAFVGLSIFVAVWAIRRGSAERSEWSDAVLAQDASVKTDQSD